MNYSEQTELRRASYILQSGLKQGKDLQAVFDMLRQKAAHDFTKEAMGRACI